MKKIVLLTGLLFSSLSLVSNAQSGPSCGQGGQGRPGGAGGTNGEFRQRMLQRFDTNRDGVLDDSEKAQMREFMQARRMQEGSGPGGQNFAQGGNEQREQFRERMMQRFDANHDGKLDDGERQQMHEAMERRMGERQFGNPAAARTNQ